MCIEGIERICVYDALNGSKVEQINIFRLGDFMSDFRRGFSLVLSTVCDATIALHNPPYKTTP